jgi:DNA-binding NtrC family response regulator
MTYHFLLIGDAKQHWRRTLQEAIAPLGEMDVCSESESRTHVSKGLEYDLVIMDATEVGHVESLVAQFHRQLTKTRIVVATAAPTWQNARAAFRAGAIDYIRKYSEKDRLSAFLLEILAKPVLR